MYTNYISTLIIINCDVKLVSRFRIQDSGLNANTRSEITSEHFVL